MHENALDVLFETELQHLVGLVKNNSLHLRKVNVTAFDMVKNATSGSNKNVDSTTEFAGLVLDRHTSINGEGVELIGSVLDGGENICNLTRAIKHNKHLPKWPIHVWGSTRWLKFCGFPESSLCANIQSRARRNLGSYQSQSNRAQ
jgi:hypothetical protein